MANKAYIVDDENGGKALIVEGSPGYLTLDWELAAMLEDKIGATPAEVQAAKMGSMFGWDQPCADPANYSDNGVRVSGFYDDGENGTPA